MRKQNIILAMAATCALAGVAYAQSARDYISIVGSSTVYPFSTTVAEHFGKANSKFKTPRSKAPAPVADSNCSAAASACNTLT